MKTEKKTMRTVANRRPLRRLGLSIALLGAAGAILAGPASAAPPTIEVSSNHYPSILVPNGPSVGANKFEISLGNISDVPLEYGSDPLIVSVDLPNGITAEAAATDPVGQIFWGCTIAPDAQRVECQFDPFGFAEFFGPGLLIEPGRQTCDGFAGIGRCPLVIEVDAKSWAHGIATADACGGGASACANDADPTTAGFVPAEFGLKRVKWRTLSVADRSPSKAAAEHPWALTTRVQMNTAPAENQQGLWVPDSLRTLDLDFPKGLALNPTATPDLCPPEDFAVRACAPETQVGTLNLRTGTANETRPLWNLEPPEGLAGQVGANVENVAIVKADATVTPEGDYRIMSRTRNISELDQAFDVQINLWGVPADPSHDTQRDTCAFSGGLCPVTAPRVPFITNPTRCTGESLGTVAVEAWHQNPGVFDTDAQDLYPGGLTGCDQPEFEPTIEARPTTTAADTPTGLEVDLHIPLNEDPDGLGTAQLKDATVSLPAGLAVNPSSADGLEACTPGEIGLTSPAGQAPAHFDDDAPACPDGAKIGTVEVQTPLLKDPLPGSVYLASQGQNPFGSLLAIYLAIDDPKTGVVVKLAGEVSPDPVSGQLTTSFEQNPQLPFEDFELKFFDGPRASLSTPASCGGFTTAAQMVPWTTPEGASASSQDSFTITSGPDGAPCPSGNHLDPSFEAGTVTTIAGKHSPLVVNASRPDGSAPLTGLHLALPEGLTGKLAGIPACPESALAAAEGRDGTDELAAPSCPAASKVGEVTVGAGAGPAPFHVKGSVYLAGPYKSAPISLAVITPAVAGPFDLGTVVTRAALQLDPVTTAISVTSDPIPQILQGIPLKVRSVSVDTDRPDFTLNPTDCDPMTLAGTLFGENLPGDDTPASMSVKEVLEAPVSNHFQVNGCDGLPFAPKLSLALKGKVHRRAHPSLRATLTAKPGDANIKKAQVKLPKAAFLDNAHITGICTRVDFAKETCPAGSVYGRATATSPLLDYALTGKVYLRANPAHKLPDLVVGFKGPAHQPITVELAGKTDSVKGALRNTFEAVPDVPVTKFSLTLFGGKKGLVELSEGFCARPRATVRLDAQSGAIHDSRPKVKAKGCGKSAR